MNIYETINCKTDRWTPKVACGVGMFERRHEGWLRHAPCDARTTLTSDQRHRQRHADQSHIQRHADQSHIQRHADQSHSQRQADHSHIQREARQPHDCGTDTLARQRRYWRGLLAEVLAAARLMLAGYCILAWRYRTPAGEIDLVAVRGRRLAFVEVKQRSNADRCMDAMTTRQRNRVVRAAALWQKQHNAFRHHEPGFDAIFVIPGHWPRYWRDAFPFARA
jgi:putative endonuclease